MTSLILGSDGQIGQPLHIHLRKSDIVYGYDADYGSDQDLRSPQNCETLSRQIRENGVDFIYFLAYDVGGSKYLARYQNTYEFLDNNVKIMENVFNLLRETNVPFIFASSQMATMTHSPYGVLKRLGEFYTKALGGINVRFWNVYAYESNPNKAHVITDFIRMAHEDGEIRMRTTGREKRQFLWGEDCAEALQALANNYWSISRRETYNITSGSWVSIRSVAEIAADIVDREDVRIVLGEAEDTVQGVVNSPLQNMTSIWTPKTSLKEGMQQVYRSMYLPIEPEGRVVSNV